MIAQWKILRFAQWLKNLGGSLADFTTTAIYAVEWKTSELPCEKRAALNDWQFRRGDTSRLAMAQAAADSTSNPSAVAVLIGSP